MIVKVKDRGVSVEGLGGKGKRRRTHHTSSHYGRTVLEFQSSSNQYGQAQEALVSTTPSPNQS